MSGHRRPGPLGAQAGHIAGASRGLDGARAVENPEVMDGVLGSAGTAGALDDVFRIGQLWQTGSELGGLGNSGPDGPGGPKGPGGRKPPPKNICAEAFTVVARCRILKADGGRVQLTAVDPPGFSGGSYEWTTSSPRLRLLNHLSNQATAESTGTVSPGRDAEVVTVTRTAPGCPSLTQQVTLTIADVTFTKSPNQRYGHDDFDTPANPRDDHLSIRKSDHSFVNVTIAGGALGSDFEFVAEDGSAFTTLPDPPPGSASFELRLNAGAHNKVGSPLVARVRCPSAVVFGRLNVHVYKEKRVEVVVAKIDSDAAGANLRFPAADYAAHTGAINASFKEGVVRCDIANFRADNGITVVNLAGGGSTVTYDIAANGGADLAAIGAAMSGTGSKRRVAIFRSLRSIYRLTADAEIGATTMVVNVASTFYRIGSTIPVDTGANREVVTVTALAGNTITCTPLTMRHPAGTEIEFAAAGWSSDPILIMEGNASLDDTRWTIGHEFGHSDLKLKDVTDTTSVMYFMQGSVDHRLRYCPRTHKYPAGTTATENQWETIPRT